MSEPSVLYELREDTAVVTLNEPARVNPLSESLTDGLLDALQRVRDDRSVRAMLLRANGAGFSSGADLKDFASRLEPPDAQTRAPVPGTGHDAPPRETLGQYTRALLTRRGNPVVLGLRSLPVPVVCAVHGAAAGGGFGLALAGDVVVAARSAFFYLPFIPALGAVPDMGATWVLPRAVGRARALGLSLLGERLSAQQAADWGLIWACVDDARLHDEAWALAQRLASLPAHAITEARAIFAASEGNSLEQQLALECERQAELLDGESFAEGVRAFQQRRKPRFSGR